MAGDDAGDKGVAATGVEIGVLGLLTLGAVFVTGPPHALIKAVVPAKTVANTNELFIIISSKFRNTGSYRPQADIHTVGMMTAVLSVTG